MKAAIWTTMWAALHGAATRKTMQRAKGAHTMTTMTRNRPGGGTRSRRRMATAPRVVASVMAALAMALSAALTSGLVAHAAPSTTNPACPNASSSTGATCTYTFSGVEQTFTVPTGVSSVLVIAHGGHGGAGSYGIAGGRGAAVRGALTVTPGEMLYVEVGGAASSAGCGISAACAGGWNGGGSSHFGGGGGGASDVRTCSMSDPACQALIATTQDPRLLVAAGGGGGGDDGYCGAEGQVPGGSGGDGGSNGSVGGGCPSVAGGAEGVAGAASSAAGANGGKAPYNTAETGGAGGGGLRGGGGGGGLPSSGSDFAGAGGGGGGTNLLPSGGSAGVDTTNTPLVTFSWDTTSPTTSLAVNPATANGDNGWYATTPSVRLSASDPDDGVSTLTTYYGFDKDGCAPTATDKCQTYSGTAIGIRDGQHTLTYFSADPNGNVEGAQQQTFQVDTKAPSAPVASFNPASVYTDGNGQAWYKDGVTVSFGGSTDPTPGSGVDPTSYSAPQTFSGTGSYSYSGSVKDNAGNVSSATTGTVYVDAKAPTDSPSHAPTSVYTDPRTENQWYNQAVTVTWNWADEQNGSGLDTSNCTARSTTRGDGQQQVSASCADHVGHVSSDSEAFYVDTTPPVVSFTSCPSVVLLNGSASAMWTASDAGSGLATASSGTINLATGSVGKRSVSGPTAKDNVGNASIPATCAYTVGYKWSGFAQPINDPAAGATTMSVFKAGSTIPVKFQLHDANGTVVQAGSLPTFSVSAPTACSSSSVDASSTTDTGDTGSTYRWDSTSQQYIYNYHTDSSLAGMCQSIQATLDDGTTQRVEVAYK